MPYKIDIIDPEGEGGQKVYPRPMWVRVTDEETGLMTACMSARSQHQNREVALAMMAWGRVQLGLPEQPPVPGEANQ